MARKVEVQLRIVKPGKHLLAEGYLRQGRTFWTTREAATNDKGTGYIDTGLAELVTGPAETPAVGPDETKPAGPAEKKSSDGGQVTPSTDSQKSSAAGTVGSSSASGAARASRSSRSKPSAPGGSEDLPMGGSAGSSE